MTSGSPAGEPVLAAAVQLDARIAEVEHNLRRCEQLADEAGAAGARVIALPEFFTTGIAFDPALSRAALPPDGAATTLLQRLARRHGALVGGSFLCRDADGHVRNCLFAREESDLRAALRGGATDEEIARRWQAAMATKLPGHGIDDPTFLQPSRPMSAIGG